VNTYKRGAEEKIARDGCTRRRNRTAPSSSTSCTCRTWQVYEVNEEGAVPTVGEEEAENDVGESRLAGQSDAVVLNADRNVCERSTKGVEFS